MATTDLDRPPARNNMGEVQFKNPKAQALWDAYITMIKSMSDSLARAAADDLNEERQAK